MTRFAIAAIATLGLVLAAAPGARAQNKSCSTTMTGSVVHGNLVVPPNSTCTLNSTTVDGNVAVGSGATLQVNDGVTIGGNIDTGACHLVTLTGNAIFVGGNVSIRECSGPNGYRAGSGFIIGTSPSLQIAGNFVCQNNDSPCVISGGRIGGNAWFVNMSGGAQVLGAEIGGNLLVSDNGTATAGGSTQAAVVTNSTVYGNVKVFNNSGPSAQVVGGNVIYGNLFCQDNTPDVNADNDGPSTVGGNKLGQCAGL
ncbi:MAG: hypothetical protein JO110_03705 [Acetobacteraceae bacterium]|nr:hypothetical protein [Acetobacteraceae bacterium]